MGRARLFFALGALSVLVIAGVFLSRSATPSSLSEQQSAVTWVLAESVPPGGIEKEVVLQGLGMT